MVSQFLIASLNHLNAQSPVQTIRGTVIDQESENSLPGCHTYYKFIFFHKGCYFGPDGIFRAENIPVGRYNVEARFVGYEPRVIPEVLLTSARPVVLEIRLQESLSESRVWKSRHRPGKTFPLTEWLFPAQGLLLWRRPRRFAGGFDDPGRMAAAFAGVAGGSPNDNALSIRGNAPKGLLWRVEGVAVPNPITLLECLWKAGESFHW